MKSENEQTISEPWTKHEHYVFVASYKTLKRIGKQINTTNLLELYNLVKQIADQDSIDVILANKTAPQITSKLHQQQKEIDVQTKCGKINYLPG